MLLPIIVASLKAKINLWQKKTIINLYLSGQLFPTKFPLHVVRKTCYCSVRREEGEVAPCSFKSSLSWNLRGLAQTCSNMAMSLNTKQGPWRLVEPWLIWKKCTQTQWYCTQTQWSRLGWISAGMLTEHYISYWWLVKCPHTVRHVEYFSFNISFLTAGKHYRPVLWHV